MLRSLRIILEFLPQPGDVHIDGSRGNVARIFPYVLEQFFPRHDAPAMIHQVAKQLQFLAGHVHFAAGLVHLGALEIHFDIAEFESLHRNPLILPDAAEQRFHPRQQFGGIERLGQIIIGAEL